MKILLKLSLAVFLILQNIQSQGAEVFKLLSPNGVIQIEVSVSNKIYYKVSYGQEKVMQDSPIALMLNNNIILGANPIVISKNVRKVDNLLTPLWGNAKFIDNKFNELTINFKQSFSLQFRAYDDGVGYRFITSFKEDIVIQDEQVAYYFAENLNFYFPTNQNSENEYIIKDFYSIDQKKSIYLPLLLRDKLKSKSHCVMLTEVDATDYPSLILKKSTDWLTNLQGEFKKYPSQFKQGGYLDYTPMPISEESFIAKTKGSRSFPWRAMIITHSEKELLQQNLVYKMAKECAQPKNFNWVKPGLCVWEYWSNLNLEGVDFKIGQNKETYKYYFDFAAKYQIPYVVIDWKWSHVHDLYILNQEMDVPNLVKYASEKNLKVVLWVLAHTLYKDLEKNLDHIKSLGASGIKVDFFDRDDQLSNQMYERIAEACARRKLIVDFHGCARPSGLEKCYPNILNFEAVMGNEFNLLGNGFGVDHHLNVAYIRAAIGPMDFTPGGFRNMKNDEFKGNSVNPQVRGTRANQMAMFIVYPAGLQMLCDSPVEYSKSEDLFKLIANTPPTWDTTIALQGKLDEYLVVAKKAGNDWYIGALNSDEARLVDVDLSFLDESATYAATIVTDGINADILPRDYKIVNKQATSKTTLNIRLARGGGTYIKLSKL